MGPALVGRQIAHNRHFRKVRATTVDCLLPAFLLPAPWDKYEATVVAHALHHGPGPTISSLSALGPGNKLIISGKSSLYSLQTLLAPRLEK